MPKPAVRAAVSSAPSGQPKADTLASKDISVNSLNSFQQRSQQVDLGDDRAVSSPDHEQNQQLMQMNQQQRKHSDKSKMDDNAEGGLASTCELVDLTLDDCEQMPAQEPKAKRLRVELYGASQCAQTLQAPLVDAALGHTQTASSQWACPKCTLLNSDITVQCSACGSVKLLAFSQASCKAGVSQRPVLQLPQTLQRPVVPVDHRAWPCNFCSLLNASGASKCSACDQWRYSYGAPLASRPTV